MIPSAAAAQISRFLELAGARLGGRVEAVWVEGSIALRDFDPRASDIDLVVLTREEVPRRERISIRGRPHVEVVWMTNDRLQTLAACDGGVGCVLAATLHRHGLSVRGPSPRELVSDVDHPVLARGVLANLEAYWVPWLDRARHHWLDRLAGLHPERVFWGIAGVPRQYVSITEGTIVSKCAAVRRARDCFDVRWHRILDEALRIRTGRGRSSYSSPIARRRDMLDFVEHAIERTRDATMSRSNAQL